MGVTAIPDSCFVLKTFLPFAPLQQSVNRHNPDSFTPVQAFLRGVYRDIRSQTRFSPPCELSFFRITKIRRGFQTVENVLRARCRGKASEPPFAELQRKGWAMAGKFFFRKMTIVPKK